MSEQLSLETVARWRSKTLLSSEGQEIGQVEQVVYDYLTREPIGLGVDEGVESLAVPVAGARAEGDHVRCAFTREQIENQPPSDFGQGFSSWSEERHVYD